MTAAPDLPASGAVARAWADAERGAQAAGVVVREVSSVADLSAVRQVFDTVWNADPANPAATVELLRAYAHTGQYVVLAQDAGSGELLAASVAFLGAPIGRALHSNITGVLPAGLGRSLGFAIKLHQRAWALGRGLDLVTWTFDPLIRRNAWFNLAKLGARPVEYLDEFYGPMDDAINAGDASDRLYVSWPLDDPRVAAAAAGQAQVVDVDALRRKGSRVLLSIGEGGLAPVVGDAAVASEAGPQTALVQVPPDIEALRGQDPALASAWRSAVRQTLGGAMRAGWQVSGFGRDGWYVLEPPHPEQATGREPS